MRVVVADFEEVEGRVVVVPVSLLLSVRTCALLVAGLVVTLVAVERLVELVAVLLLVAADLFTVPELLRLLLADAAAAEPDLRPASPR